MGKSLYDILEVGRDANADAIEAAYQRLREKNVDRADERGRLALMAMQEAYETLRNPTRRAAYDRGTSTAKPAQQPQTSAASRLWDWLRSLRMIDLLTIATLFIGGGLVMKYSTEEKLKTPKKDAPGIEAKRTNTDKPRINRTMEPPPPPPAHLRALGQAGWSVDERTGCWVWNAIPKRNETVEWSGGCGSDGPATGHGVLDWLIDGKVVARYEGDYLAGKADGVGVLTSGNGSRYEGGFREGELHGWGVLTLSDGQRYEGEVRDGKPNGEGVWTRTDGSRYEGQWRDGKQDGRGLATWPNGDRYEGEHRNGKPHGSGTATVKGRTYGGNWVDGCSPRRAICYR